MPIGRFLPNPFAALDADGRPAGRFPLLGGLYVGAEIDAKRTRILQKAVPERGIPGRQRTISKFFTEPQTWPIDQHMRMGVSTGEIIPADLETALACGVAEKDYEGPEAAWSKARKAAIDKYTAQYGKAPALIDEDGAAAGEQENAKRLAPKAAERKSKEHG